MANRNAKPQGGQGADSALPSPLMINGVPHHPTTMTPLPANRYADEWSGLQGAQTGKAPNAKVDLSWKDKVAKGKRLNYNLDRPTIPHRDIDLEGNQLTLTPQQHTENAAAEAAQKEFDTHYSAQTKQDEADKAKADAIAKANEILANVPKGGRASREAKPTAANLTPGVVAQPTLKGAAFTNRAGRAHRLMTEMVNNHLASKKLDKYPNAKANLLVAKSKLDEVAPVVGNGGSAHVRMATHDQVGANQEVIDALPALRQAHDALDHPEVHAHGAEINMNHELPTGDLTALEADKGNVPLVKQSAKPIPDMEFGRKGRMRTDSPEFQKLDESIPEGTVGREKLDAAKKPTKRMSRAERRALTAEQAAKLQANIRTTRRKADDVTRVDTKFQSDANRVGVTPKFDATSGIAGATDAAAPAKTADLGELMARGRESAKAAAAAKAAADAAADIFREREAAGPQRRPATRRGKAPGFAPETRNVSPDAKATAELPSVNPGGDPNTRPLGINLEAGFGRSNVSRTGEFNKGKKK